MKNKKAIAKVLKENMNATYNLESLEKVDQEVDWPNSQMRAMTSLSLDSISTELESLTNEPKYGKLVFGTVAGMFLLIGW